MSPNGVRRRVIIAYEETSEQLATYDLIIQIVKKKQRQTLIRFFFNPFWEALSATLVFLGVLLSLSQAWVLFSGTLIVSGFSLFMTWRCRSSLKQIESELSKLQQGKLSAKGQLELAGQASPFPPVTQWENP